MKKSRASQMDLVLSKLAKFTALAVVFSIPFGVKKFLYAFWGRPADISSVFLYATDILLAFALLFFILSKKDFSKESGKWLLGAFIITCVVSIIFSLNQYLSLYFLVRICLGVLFGFLLISAIENKLVSLMNVYVSFLASAFLQTFIGLFQFFSGRSAGLHFLGEPFFDDGVARVLIAGTEYLRAYGTMAHANILAAFLGIGVLALFGIWISHSDKASIFNKIYFFCGFSILLMGVVVTFSRSGWLALLISLIFVFISIFFLERKRFFDICSPIVIALALVVISMNWAIAPRAHLSSSEPSVNLRVVYNQMGFSILSKHPLGVGIGNMVPKALLDDIYKKNGIIREWDFQPIHNLYLLSAVEIGIQGFLVFMALFAYFAHKLFSSFSNARKNALEYLHFIIPSAMFVFMLVFGLFDHFFWTLEAGRLMLFSVLGIVMGISSPRRSMDRTLASEAGN